MNISESLLVVIAFVMVFLMTPPESRMGLIQVIAGSLPQTGLGRVHVDTRRD